MTMKRIGSMMVTLILLLSAVLTVLPTSALAAGSTPDISLGAGALTAGNKVWFGSYSNLLLLWRVLQSGDGKALLISNDTLGLTNFNQSTSDGNAWSGSKAQTWCKDFKNDKNFTASEQAAILATTIEETNDKTYNDKPYYYKGGYGGTYYYGAAPLNGEYFFFLSAKEADTLFASDDDRKASGASSSYWWLRSPLSYYAFFSGIVDLDGWVNRDSVDIIDGARPAFNLNLSSVLYTTAVSGETDAWKLGLYDSNMTVNEGSGGVTRSGSTVTVPYSITGTNAGNANKVALLITNKNDTWSATNGWSSGAAKLYYETQALTATSGMVSFTLPDSLKDKVCGTDYKAWLLAVDENGNHESDYASAPVSVTIPEDAEKYPLWIGGVQADENNCNNLSTNHWSYNPATHTLTLSGYGYGGKGYNYSGSYYAGIYYNGTDALTISLANSNSVTQTKNYGDPGDCPIVIDSAAALTITGSGSLAALQGNKWNYGPAILSSGPITLSGGTVNAVGAYYNGIKAPSVTVKSTVTSVDIKGTGDSAKAVDGTLINEMGGVGYNKWNKPTKIAANTTGAVLTYQHVVFPIAKYTIEFDPNGGSGSIAPVTVEEGQTYELPACGFTPPTDKKFNWWDVHGIDLIGIPGTPAVITSNCADENGIVTIKALWIDADKAPQATVKTAPVNRTHNYNGASHALVEAGEAEGGTMQYALGEDDTTAPTSGWSESIPTGVNPVGYFIWYKAVGDNAHRDSDAACVTAAIYPGFAKVTAKDQTIKEGEGIQTGTSWATLKEAGSGHTLSAVTLTVDADAKTITPSAAKIQDANGKDVTNYYGSFSYVDGALTVVPKISATVTFTVVNGSWDDGTKDDIAVPLEGYEGDTLKLTAAQIPGVGSKPNDTFKAGSWDTTPSTETAFADGSETTYIYTYAAKDAISQTVTFKVVNGSWDDGTAGDKTVTLTGHEGDTLKLSAVQIPAVGGKPAASYQVGSWDVTPSTETAITGPTTYTYTYAAVISYSTVSGDGQEWRIDSNGDMEFIVKRSVNDELTFPNFRSAALDGQGLNAGEYDTAQGSLIFTLKAAKAKTLALGAHTLTFTFTDGTATAAFTLKPVAGSFEDVAVPSTSFTFKKVWEGGSEKSIDFTLYKMGDTVYHHGFDKKIVSKTEWQYNAWFSEAVACYVIEEPVPGYKTVYENVGVYAGITDRCCDGGTIVNYKVPKTGDDANLTLWIGCALAGLAVVSVAVFAGKRKKAQSK